MIPVPEQLLISWLEIVHLVKCASLFHQLLDERLPGKLPDNPDGFRVQIVIAPIVLYGRHRLHLNDPITIADRGGKLPGKMQPVPVVVGVGREFFADGIGVAMVIV